MKYISILPLLFTVSVLSGQGRIVLRSFKASLQEGGDFNGSPPTDYDFVLRVCSDSSVQFDTYRRVFGFMRGGLYKTCFSGKARIHSDTLAITWVSDSFAVVAIKMTAVRGSSDVSNKYGRFLPPALFVRINDKLWPQGNLLPVLAEVDFENVVLVEISFNKEFSVYTRFNARLEKGYL